MDEAPRRQTGYGDVDDSVAQLLAAVSGALGESFVGLYLGGSLATGAFYPETSDIDFVVITAREVSEDLVERLRRAHEGITRSSSKWATKLEGLYLPREAARSHGARGTGEQRCAYLGIGGWFGVVPYQSDWIVQLHLVREHGIVVAGPDPKTLIDPVTPLELRAACAAIMRDWEPLLHDTSRFDAEYQAYAVLTMCRVLYTLEHGAVESKATAATWAKRHLGRQWDDVIDTALAWRHGMPFERLEEVLDLIRHTLARCRDGGEEG